MPDRDANVDRTAGLAPIARDGAFPAARLGVGTALFGLGGVDQAEASRAVRSAVDAGIRLFDTAPLYGYGTAERTLGAALRDLGDVDRPSLVISTKVGRLVDDDAREVRYDFSRDGVRRSWATSLARLGLDRVDILYLHDPGDGDLARGLTEAYSAMAELRSEGAVRAIGVGVNDVATALRFVRETDIDLVLIAGRHTLLDRSADAELVPAAAERGVRLVAGGVFNSGLLATGSAASTFDYLPPPAETMARVTALRQTCEGFGIPLRTAALRFPERSPVVVSTLIGIASEAQLHDNIEAMASEIPDALWDALDALAPGEGAA